MTLENCKKLVLQGYNIFKLGEDILSSTHPENQKYGFPILPIIFMKNR